MGKMIDGTWHTDGDFLAKQRQEGRFQRAPTTFRERLEPGGDHPPARGRYHLYVSYACPWAHRTLIFRKLKGLEDIVSFSAVTALMLDDGWEFTEEFPDPILGKSFLREVYAAAKADYTGRVTVPVLWDREKATIVNNESAEIIRLFGSAFDDLGAKPGDYYPEELRADIDAINERVYETLNNGVYKCGFAAGQADYEEAVVPLFETLDFLEKQLEGKRFLFGDRLTEADVRLFVTLIRFDPVYVTHFKCNLRRIVDYPNLWRFTRRVYAMEGVAETVRFDHIKNHYFASHRSINPSQVVPLGPVLDYRLSEDER